MGRFLPLAATVCLFLGACAPPSPLHGTALSPPKAARRFVLIDQNGARYTLAQEQNRFTALYFGFTHCKDVCPQTLALLGNARVRAGLTPAQLQIVMVSVDPARDTAGAMRAFFAKVGVQAVGLRAPAAQMARVYRAYGVAIEAKHHDIGHTDVIYLLDQQGRMREVLSPQTSIDAVAQDLRALVE